MKIQDLRRKIDNVDRRLLALLNERTSLVSAVGQWKLSQGQRVLALDREEHLLRQLEARNAGPMSNESLRAIYREILSCSRAVQGPLTIGYLGTLTEEAWLAARHRFGANSGYRSCRSLKEILTLLRRGKLEAAVVPREAVVEALLGGQRPAGWAVCGDIVVPDVEKRGGGGRRLGRGKGSRRRNICFVLCREAALVVAQTKTAVLVECVSSQKSFKRIKALLEMHNVALLSAEDLTAAGRKAQSSLWQLDLQGYVSQARLGSIFQRCAPLVTRWLTVGTYPDVPEYA